MNQYYYYYHWIAIYVDENGHYGEHFDSLGRVPTHTFERNMNTVANRFITVNNYRVLLVDFVDTGHYCACFCFFFSRGIDMRRFQLYFTRDTGLNDAIVHELMCNV